MSSQQELLLARLALPAHQQHARKRRSKEKQTGRKAIDPFAADELVTADELATVLETARAHTITRLGNARHPYRSLAPFLLRLARMGLRLSEVIALRWGDIDWRGHSLHVERAYVRGDVGPQKGGKDQRVDLSDELAAALRGIYRDRFETVVADDAEAEAALEAERAAALGSLVFPDTSGTFFDDHNLRHRVWEPLLVAAGLRHRRLHDLGTRLRVSCCKTAPSCCT